MSSPEEKRPQEQGPDTPDRQGSKPPATDPYARDIVDESSDESLIDYDKVAHPRADLGDRHWAGHYSHAFGSDQAMFQRIDVRDRAVRLLRARSPLRFQSLIGFPAGGRESSSNAPAAIR